MGRTRPSPSPAEGSAPGRPRSRSAGGALPRPGAVEAALELLARRPRTTAEILTWLRGRRYTEEEASSAVARLRELGYLDDSAYAATFAGTIARSRAWGPRRVKQELARRGIAPAAIEQGLARAEADGASTEENLRRAVARLTRGGAPPGSPREGRRLRAALMRRGYDPDSIAEALAALGDDSVDAEGSGEAPEEPGEDS